MEKVVLKIGGDANAHIKRIFEDPSARQPGVHTIYFKNLNQFREILTARRISLLDYLFLQAKEKNVSEIAFEIHRKQEAVSRDLAILEEQGLIAKTKRKQAVYPRIAFSRIEIDLPKRKR